MGSPAGPYLPCSLGNSSVSFGRLFGGKLVGLPFFVGNSLGFGPHGRRGLISLSAMGAEFIGLGRGAWPAMTARLLAERHITRQAHESACLLHAFGTLIGNTDMHPGNLSFVTDSGRPYQLAPAYDMLPMAFAPRSSGELPATLPAAGFDSQISTAQWRKALALALAYLGHLNKEAGFSVGFGECLAALERHLQTAEERIGRLA